MADLSSIHKLHHATLTKHWTAAWFAVTLNLTNDLHCEHESTSQANRRHKRRSPLNEIRHSCVSTFTREFVFGKEADRPLIPLPADDHHFRTSRLAEVGQSRLAMIRLTTETAPVGWPANKPCARLKVGETLAPSGGNEPQKPVRRGVRATNCQRDAMRNESVKRMQLSVSKNFNPSGEIAFANAYL